jgi:hypothetical protein
MMDLGEVGWGDVDWISLAQDRNRFFVFFYQKDPIYLQSVIIHSANGGKGEGRHVEEYSVALLC